MEDKEEEQASCSKRNSPRDSSHELREKKEDGRRDEERTESSASNSSMNSRMDNNMAKTLSKSALQKKDLKMPGSEGKKRMRNSGRVTKRTAPTRRQPKRACTNKRKYTRPKPDKKRVLREPASVSTVFTRVSSASSLESGICQRCRRCRSSRRYYNTRRTRNKKIAKRKNVRRKRVNFVGAQNTASECLQAGSCAMMLSPLLVKENPAPLEDSQAKEYCGITPEMIYFSIRELMMWRHDVEITSIAEYLKNHYPVCDNSEALLEELREKLRIAAIVGMVIETSLNHWCLSPMLYKRKLNKNHVTLFWKLYGDTMKPIYKKEKPKQGEIEDRNTNTIEHTIV